MSKFSQHHSSLNTLCESSKCLIYALHVVRLWVNASMALPAMSATDGSIECLGQVIFFSLFAPSFQHIYAFIWKLVISIKVAFLCRALNSVNQLLINSKFSAAFLHIYTRGESTRGRNDLGAKRLGGKRPGGKRLGGETTGGGNGLGAKLPGFTVIEAFWLIRINAINNITPDGLHISCQVKLPHCVFSMKLLKDHFSHDRFSNENFREKKELPCALHFI